MSLLANWLRDNDGQYEYICTTYEYGPVLGQAIPYPILEMGPELWVDLYYKTEIELIILDQMIREVTDAKV
jgi:hypothetical protein